MSIKIIAEIGINHNGDINIAKELIKAMHEAGVDLVKFQKRTIDLVYTKEMLDSSRESPWGTTQRDQKEGLEFTFDEYKEIDSYCKSLNIDWFASAWDSESQLFLRKFDLNFNKIASAMIVDLNLLEMVAEEKRHTFISTGMSTFEEIDKAVDIFSKHSCPFELMHTISTYPMKNEHANLKLISTLKERYGCNVGYSGHENGILVSLGAVGLGISSLERHVTLDRTMYGSDQSASIEIAGMKKLVEQVRILESAMGDGIKTILEEEIPIAEKLRAHIQ
jgi:N-acetylneuraminate synthase